jgi:predicted alpha/beta superfamily hydrolase
MKRNLLLVFAAVLILGALAATAATPITVGETVKLTSKLLGEERTILVATPDGYARGRQKYPVVYLTDAEAHFLHTVATIEFLARTGFMPRAIVVGVTNTDRGRDLTPSHVYWRGADDRVVGFPESSGADRFLDFFERELIPWVESNYRTEPFRVFCGHSLGGLFAVHALLSRPDLFNALVAVSPTTMWDNGLVLKRAETFFEGRKSLKRALFVAAGREGRDMQRAFDAFKDVLVKSRAEGFRWNAVTFPEEDHASVVMRSHDAGLRMIFEGWRLPHDPFTSEISVGTLAELTKHFAAVSERLGYAARPSEALVSRIGRQALLKKDFGRALEFFRYNVAAWPDSAGVYDSLGEALERQGMLADALSSYARAAELGEKSGDPNAVLFRKNAERLRERISKTEPLK